MSVSLNCAASPLLIAAAMATIPFGVLAQQPANPNPPAPPAGQPTNMPAPGSGAPEGSPGMPQGSTGQQNQSPAPAGDSPRLLTIDLASPDSVMQIAPGTYQLRLINQKPQVAYRVRTKFVSTAIDIPLSMPMPRVEASDCEEKQDEIRTSLASAMCEAEVATIARTARAELELAGCSTDESEKFQPLLEALTQSELPNPPPAFELGDSFEVSVGRDAFVSSATAASIGCAKETLTPAGSQSRVETRELGTWTFEVGKSKAQWLTYYGFNFAESGDELYFAETNSGTDPTTYTIARSFDRGGDSFTPSIYFTRLPADTKFSAGRFFTGWRTAEASGGLTAGLGFDLDNPTAFLGYGVAWGYNVMLTVGTVMHKEKRLRGQYAVGDIVAESLSADQLHESTYESQAYIGIAFRFGSSPFESGGSNPPQ